MGDNDYLSLLLIVQGITALVGPNLAAYYPDIAWPSRIVQTVSTAVPSSWWDALMGTITWAWNSISFLFSLMSFQVEDHDGLADY
jgi:hypothetical protein